MTMLNSYCGVDRDSRGVVRLTISNAGSLNILGTPVINGLREGLETLAKDRDIRVLVIAGQGEKSLIGGADIKEMAKLDQPSAEKFISGLRDLCEAVRAFPAPVIARLNAAARKGTQTPEFRKKIEPEGLAISAGSPEELDTFVRAEEARWGTVVRENNLKID